MKIGGCSRALQSLLCIVWAAAPLECAGSRATAPIGPALTVTSAMDAPAAEAPETAATSSTPAAPSPGPSVEATHGPRVQLNPNQLVLPDPDPKASDAVREFTTAAARAVRQVYQADNDDPSVLLALQESLRDNGELKPAIAVWTEILQSALARSESLQAVGPALRPIREALRPASLDPANQTTIRDIDVGLCQNAFTSPIGRNRAIDGITATFNNLGSLNLGRVREACEAAAKAALEKTRLPGQTAPVKVARMVRQLCGNAHLGGEIRKVTVVTPWHLDKAKKAMVMRAAVGIVDVRGNRGCTLARLAVKRGMHGKAAPALVEVSPREPILCSQLSDNAQKFALASRKRR